MTVLTSVDVTIRCAVTGVPMPAVSWSRDGSPLAGGDRIFVKSSLLVLSRGTLADGGLYTCIASNLDGKVSADSQINFVGKRVR